MLPTRAYAGDAGLDLAACERVELAPGERALVATGLAVAIPDGYAGFVQPRSGLAAQHGITIVNTPGLVDSGYRGELRVALLNTDLRESVRRRAGDADRPARDRAGPRRSSSSRSTSCPRRSAASAASARRCADGPAARPRLRAPALAGPDPALPAGEAGQGVLAAARRRRGGGRDADRGAPARARRGGRDRRRAPLRGPDRASPTRSRRTGRPSDSTSSTSSSPPTSRPLARGRRDPATRPSAARGCSPSTSWRRSSCIRRSSGSSQRWQPGDPAVYLGLALVALTDDGARGRRRLEGWSDTRLTLAVVAVVGVLALAANAWIYAGDLTYFDGPPIRADGQGYYVYLPAILLDHDVTLVRTANRSFQGDPTNISGVAWVSVHGGAPGTRRPLDPHGVGVAILMLPFFVAGHGLAAIAGAPRDGFSWPYQAADVAAGLVYGLLGLVLLAGVLRRWFSTLDSDGDTRRDHVRRSAVRVPQLRRELQPCVLVLPRGARRPPHPRGVGEAAARARRRARRRRRPAGPRSADEPRRRGLLRARRRGASRRPRDPRAHAAPGAPTYSRVGVGVALLDAACRSSPTSTGSPAQCPDQPVPALRSAGSPRPACTRTSSASSSACGRGSSSGRRCCSLAVAGIPFLRRAAPPLLVPTVAYLAVETWVVASWSVWWYGGVVRDAGADRRPAGLRPRPRGAVRDRARRACAARARGRDRRDHAARRPRHGRLLAEERSRSTGRRSAGTWTRSCATDA